MVARLAGRVIPKRRLSLALRLDPQSDLSDILPNTVNAVGPKKTVRAHRVF